MSFVTSYLMGGLGNQLFQIFTAINYSLKYNCQIFFTDRKELIVPGSTTRYTYWNTFLKNIKHFVINNNINTTRIDENYQLYIPNFNRNIELFGYFQSYKYFDENINRILDIIKFKDIQNEVKEENSGYFLKDTYKVSMHFRLGDYKHLAGYHPVMPYKYYEEALKSLLKILEEQNIKENIEILYCCEKEDNEIVNETIEKLKFIHNDIIFTKVEDNLADWKQMVIMSMCNSNIIANSSFSWWSGYLNNNKNKVVIYPSVWFGEKINKDVSNMFYNEWIKIKV
jgi:hypothetical protein